MSITVYDGTGRIVTAPFQFTGTGSTTLDLKDVSPGVYYLMATRNGAHQAVKLMIEH